MKNKSVIIGIISVVLICIITTGCIFYNLLDADEFKEHFTELGYKISDTEEEEFDAKTFLVASKDDQEYKILYYEFDKEVDAKKAYQDYKENISDYITSTSQNQEKTGAVFSKITAVSEEEYIVISRVKNTLIFIAGTNDVSEDIDKILEDIRY